ncbi:MAG: sporulation protein YqfD, partial [Clostridia bacterium]
MLFKILLRYILGYVNIRIEGYFAEKFINKCINNKIFFWGIKREKSTIVYTNVGIRDFKRMCKIAKETRCKINILHKKGLPFVLHRYKKRKIFLLIIIIILFSLLTLSRFVWNIKIEGLEQINEEEIMTILNEKGLQIGKAKNDIDKQKIINEIRLERADIAWIGISIDGTIATVKIVEAEKKPEMIDDEEYCNIVSTKDAQIVKISAQNGVPVANVGDIVTKGDILIAGWIEGKYTGTRYVHAEGEIQAKVWYTEKEQIPLK